MKIVKFKSGKYGIRRLGLFGYQYYDITDDYWWPLGSKFLKHCKTDLETCKQIMERFKDPGEPI